ncbi:MAG: alkaline phosphatase family protein [Candidatus Cybelea sp.]
MTKQLVALALACAVAGCAGSTAPPFSGVYPEQSRGAQGVTPSSARVGRTTTPIKHVVYIIQENRSFNDMFYGFPGATTAKYGFNSQGKKIELTPQSLATSWDLGHASQAFFAACDGQGALPGTDCKMDGWNNENSSGYGPSNPQYTYVKESQIAPYWAMAQQYVLADNMFASNLDGSFIAHQYVVAGFASSAVDFPDGAWGCEGGKTDTVRTITMQRTYGSPIETCFENPTLAAEADAAGVKWRFYSDATNESGGLWSSYQADKPIYDGPDWNTNVINPPSQFLTDIGKGELAQITWITPTWPTSDHPGGRASEGPSWVASIVDAVGKSKFWKSTAIFIQWDDWGGFFDPVKPVFEDYDGLGFRVGLIMISPYAKKGSVTHVQYETASVLRFIEDNFGLAQMAASDKRASDPANDSASFDFTQKPRRFKGIAGSKPSSYWSRIDRSWAGRGRPASALGDD